MRGNLREFKMFKLICIVFLWDVVCATSLESELKYLKDELLSVTTQVAGLKKQESRDIAELKRQVTELRNEITANNEQRAEKDNDILGPDNIGKIMNSDKAEAAAGEGTLQDCGLMIESLQSETRKLWGTSKKLKLEMWRLKKQVKAATNDFDRTNQVIDFKCPTCHAVRHESTRLRQVRIMHRKVSDILKWKRKAEIDEKNTKKELEQIQIRLSMLNVNNLDILDEDVRLNREKLANLSKKVEDFDKMHVSMLELLENVQNVENKVDKTLPEFRKEISKLGANLAQVNSHISYNREDTENLRQSVKAIAFSISTAIDKADLDRKLMQHLNYSVTALQQLSKQHSYRLYDHMLKSEKNQTHNEETPSYLPNPLADLPELMGEVKDLQPAEKEYEELISKLPRDCSTVDGPPGKYMIVPGPAGSSPVVDTWCNNGSTLLQRRLDGSVEFNVKFSDYVKPFGKPSGEYWLGLENMHLLTADNCSTMRIDMKDIYGGAWFANYSYFYVGPAGTGYKLIVGGFSGNASDAFEYQNRMEFSAIDKDRDISNTDCASNYEGGWWFSHCQHVNINGKYTLGLTWFDSERNEWIAVASSEMTMGRRDGCISEDALDSPNLDD